jgi:anti-anti-sigma regulatory factor
MEGIIKVTFPQHIGFMNVSEYMEKFREMDHDGAIVFDLSETVSVHSSFIGFLIHAKHTISKKSGKLTLLLSFTTEKLLVMLNIIDFFSPEIITVIQQRSA